MNTPPVTAAATSITPRPMSALRRRYGDAAIVTGASDGIGRAFAEQLAGAGFDLVLVARRADRLHALKTALAARHPVRVRVLPLDLSTAAAHQQLIDATAHLPLGLLVAAAGYGTSGPLLDASIDTELDMLAVNCASTLRLAHGIGRRFAAQRRGGIVLMSSLLAFQGVPRAAHYAATKAYVQVLAEGLNRELAPQGVDVIAAAPGPVHSGFAQRAGMSMAMALTPDAVARGTLAALGRRPTTRPGWLSWLLEASLVPLPRRGRTLILQQVMAGMTAGKTT